MKAPLISGGRDGSIGIQNVTLALLNHKIDILPRTHASHNAMYLADAFLVVGGNEEAFMTEKCTYDVYQMTCTDQPPLLNEYVYWPELIQVAEDYKERYCD